MQNETKVCKHCQTEIPKKAKVCPNCRKKQGGILKWIIVVIIAIVAISAFTGGDDETKKDNTPSETKKESTSDENNQKEEQIIEYTTCTVDEMMEMLESNALKAETTYQDKYVEVTGKLSTIDSDGKYISLTPVHDEWAFNGVQCYIKTDEQKSQVAEMSTGDTITVKGKITSIGELLGYSLDIDSIQ